MLTFGAICIVIVVLGLIYVGVRISTYMRYSRGQEQVVRWVNSNSCMREFLLTHRVKCAHVRPLTQRHMTQKGVMRTIQYDTGSSYDEYEKGTLLFAVFTNNIYMELLAQQIFVPEVGVVSVEREGESIGKFLRRLSPEDMTKLFAIVEVPSEESTKDVTVVVYLAPENPEKLIFCPHCSQGNWGSVEDVKNQQCHNAA